MNGLVFTNEFIMSYFFISEIISDLFSLIHEFVGASNANFFVLQINSSGN